MIALRRVSVYDGEGNKTLDVRVVTFLASVDVGDVYIDPLPSTHPQYPKEVPFD